MNIPDNPPAFPYSTIDGHTVEGMSLRDWFAGQFLAGNYFAIAKALTETGVTDDKINPIIAAVSYSMADEMLKRRVVP